MDTNTLMAYTATKGYLSKSLGNVRGIDVMAGWVMSTWIVDRFSSVFGLHISGRKAKGKTTILTTVGDICMHPYFMNHTETDTVILGKLDSGCTLIVDDFEVAARKHGHMDIWFEVGYNRQTACVVKAECRADGKIIYPSYRVFGMKLIAAQQSIQSPVLASKFLTITLCTKKNIQIPEGVTRLEHTAQKQLLADWAATFTEGRIPNNKIFIDGLMKAVQ